MEHGAIFIFFKKMPLSRPIYLMRFLRKWALHPDAAKSGIAPFNFIIRCHNQLNFTINILISKGHNDSVFLELNEILMAKFKNNRGILFVTYYSITKFNQFFQKNVLKCSNLVGKWKIAQWTWKLENFQWKNCSIWNVNLSKLVEGFCKTHLILW